MALVVVGGTEDQKGSMTRAYKAAETAVNKALERMQAETSSSSTNASTSNSSIGSEAVFSEWFGPLTPYSLSTVTVILTQMTKLMNDITFSIELSYTSKSKVAQEVYLNAPDFKDSILKVVPSAGLWDSFAGDPPTLQLVLSRSLLYLACLFSTYGTDIIADRVNVSGPEDARFLARYSPADAQLCPLNYMYFVATML